jgi:predicted O-methyltransferase YrrM
MRNKWIRRKRNSLGFGVQSANDFYFVQHVLREQLPYYAYAEIHRLMQLCPTEHADYPEENIRLLFRLANFIHPRTIIEVGTGSGLSACAMAMSRPMGKCITIEESSTTSHHSPLTAQYPQIIAQKGDEMALFSQILAEQGAVELLHVGHTPHYREVVSMALPYMKDNALLIIEGIDHDEDKRAWWKELQEMHQRGLIYDLKSVGLLLFSQSRYRDKYWVSLRKLKNK